MPFCDTAVVVLPYDRRCACVYKGMKCWGKVFGLGVLLVTRAQVSGDKEASQLVVLGALKRGNWACPCWEGWKGWVTSDQRVIDNLV